MSARPHALEQGEIDALLIDIDDTLWENNIYFMATLEWLCKVGRTAGLSDRATGQIIHRSEMKNIPRLGYSYGSYETSFIEALAVIVHRGNMHGEWAGLRARALRWTHFLRTHPIVLLRGVSDALPVLSRAHKMIIVTKGNHHDQMSKVYRSGLLPLFHAAEVVPKKSIRDYRGVIEKHGLNPERTIMIGNSPRSDINCAKQAGLRTIYVPHPSTWYHEMEPISLDFPTTLHAPDFYAVLDLLGLPRP